MGIILFLQGFASPFLDSFFQAVTMLGEEYFYIVVLALIFWCIDKRYGYKLCFAFLLSGVVNGMVKSIVRAPRPIGVEGIRSLRVETATGASFPSGHTQNATAFWVSMMRRLRRRWVYAAGGVLILLVGASRLYLGVHWPADVLGGIVFGTASVLLADFIFERAMRWKAAWLPLPLLIPALAAAYAWRDSPDLVKGAGTFAGFLIGYTLESSFIRFSEDAPAWKQAVKAVLGVAVALAVKEGLKLLFPATPAFDFVRYLLLGLWITVGAPLVFSALRLCTSPDRKEQPPSSNEQSLQK
jgi:membrane-associated phospholipid phosphatase